MLVPTRDINGNIVFIEEKPHAVRHSGLVLNQNIPIKLPTRPKQPRGPSHHEMPVANIPPQRKVPSQQGMPKEPVPFIPPQRPSTAHVEPLNVRFEDANVRFDTSK